MANESSEDAVEIAAIEAEYPGWHVWRSRHWKGGPGMWAATRIEKSAGIHATLMEDTADELRAELEVQRKAARGGQQAVTVNSLPMDGGVDG